MIQDLKGSVWPSTAKEFVPSGKDIAVITFKKNVGTNVSFNVTSLYNTWRPYRKHHVREDVISATVKGSVEKKKIFGEAEVQ